jgi:hypothetical protein
MIAIAAQAAPPPDGQQLGATPPDLATVLAIPSSRIGYQNVAAPIVRQEVVGESFRAQVRTGAPKRTPRRHRFQMRRILHHSIHPPPKLRRHGWWTATVGHRRQQRPAKSTRRHRTALARIYFGTASLGGTPAPQLWVPGQAPMFKTPCGVIRRGA